jgi:predicted transcriptional regulator
MQEIMAHGQRAETANDEQQTTMFAKKTPAANVKRGKVEITIWPNEGNNGSFHTASATRTRRVTLKTAAALGVTTYLTWLKLRVRPQSKYATSPVLKQKHRAAKYNEMEQPEGLRFAGGSFLCVTIVKCRLLKSLQQSIPR